MVFTSKPIYNNCIMAFMMELFCSKHKSCVISAQETTQKPQNKVSDSKCTICGGKIVTICHLIAHVGYIHKEKITSVCSRL